MYFYSSLSADAPKLNNTWGDFNKLINYLIDGGSEYIINKIDPYDNKKIKVYYDATLDSSPWVSNQTIEITGSSKNYNKRYFIESIHDAEKFIICYNSEITLSTSTTEIGDADTIKAAVIPCGATRIFGGVDDSRTVFKFSTGIEYRIDDRNFGSLLTPVVTFNTSWSKVARLCMAEKFDSLDYTTSKMWPYNNTRPNENFTPSGNYIGQCFMLYNEGSAVAEYITYTSNKSANAYKVFANDNAMYIHVFPNNSYNNSSNSYFYIMGNFNQIDNNRTNGLLQCLHHYGTNSTYTQTTGVWNNSTSYLSGFTYSPNRNSICLNIWDDYTGNTRTAYFYGGFGFGSAPPSASGGLRNTNIPDSNIYFSDTQIIDTNNCYLGTLYDVKWINSAYRPTVDSLLLIDNELYISNNSHASTALFKLDRP